MGNFQQNGDSSRDPTIGCMLIDSDAANQVKHFQSSTGEQFEKYTLINPASAQFENQYQFRLENRGGCYVDVLYAGYKENNFGCAERGKYEVVTERIPYRLSDLNHIREDNAVTILATALRGYGPMFKVHGQFRVKDAMIGLNQKNQVKIWLHPNFSINHPQDSPISLQTMPSQQHQRQMVNNIFDLIASKTNGGQMWQQIMLGKQKKSSNFDQATKFVYQIAGKYGLNVSKEQVVNVFNKSNANEKLPSLQVRNQTKKQIPKQTKIIQTQPNSNFNRKYEFGEIGIQRAKQSYFQNQIQIKSGTPISRLHSGTGQSAQFSIRQNPIPISVQNAVSQKERISPVNNLNNQNTVIYHPQNTFFKNYNPPSYRAPEKQINLFKTKITNLPESSSIRTFDPNIINNPLKQKTQIRFTHAKTNDHINSSNRIIQSLKTDQQTKSFKTNNLQTAYYSRVPPIIIQNSIPFKHQRSYSQKSEVLVGVNLQPKNGVQLIQKEQIANKKVQVQEKNRQQSSNNAQSISNNFLDQKIEGVQSVNLIKKSETKKQFEKQHEKKEQTRYSPILERASENVSIKNDEKQGLQTFSNMDGVHDNSIVKKQQQAKEKRKQSVNQDKTIIETHLDDLIEKEDIKQKPIVEQKEWRVTQIDNKKLLNEQIEIHEQPEYNIQFRNENKMETIPQIQVQNRKEKETIQKQSQKTQFFVENVQNKSQYISNFIGAHMIDTKEIKKSKSGEDKIRSQGHNQNNERVSRSNRAKMTGSQFIRKGTKDGRKLISYKDLRNLLNQELI